MSFVYTLQHKKQVVGFFFKDALGITIFLIPKAYKTVLTDLHGIA